MTLYRLLLLSTICLLVVGCARNGVGTSSTDNGEVAINPNQLSPEQVAQIYHQEQISLAINKHLTDLLQASTTHSLKLTSETGLNLSKKLETSETFKEGELTAFYLKSQIQNGDQLMEEGLSYQDKKYTRYFNHQVKQESETATKQATTYLTYLKLLVESEDLFTVVEQNDETSLIRLSISDSNKLLSLLDLPIILSNQAKAEASIDYTINSQTGAIQQANLTGSVTDLGHTFQIVNTMEAKTNDDATMTAFPQDEPNQFKDSEISPESLRLANPVKEITYYESMLSQTIGENVKGELYLFNTLNSNPVMTLISPIIDNKADNLGVFYEDKLYTENDHQPLMQPIANPYKDFLNRLIAQWENTIDVETPNEENTILKREVFEDDFESMQAIAPYINLSALKRDEAAGYAIDYMIDTNTNQLRSVLFWSLVAEEEEITHHIILTFDQLNLYTPSLLGSTVSENVWKQVNEK